MLESKSISAVLLRIQSEIIDEKQESINSHRQLRKDEQINEANKYIRLKKINNQFYDKLKQEIYDCSLQNYQNKNQSMALMILLDWDFPDSEARIYVNQYMSHKLIDPNTWEIKVSNISLRKKLEEIASQFEIKRPDLDFLLHNDIDSEQQDQQFSKELDLIAKSRIKDLYTDIQPQQFVTQQLQNQIEEYIQYQENYINAISMITQKAKSNKMLEEQIIQIEKENKELREQLDKYIREFDNLSFQFGEYNQACQTIKKKFQTKELLNLLRKKIQNLEQKAEELYEDKKQQNFDKNNFEQNVQEFKNNRSLHWKCEQKRDIFIEQFLPKQ